MVVPHHKPDLFQTPRVGFFNQSNNSLWSSKQKVKKKEKASQQTITMKYKNVNATKATNS